ncbi:hypothetical protein NMY22_g14640 [Coprinellus aureogranulatus]|nr:hypothetical protein NMY22_g14640 [Coprinellus aureogranulatus]
MSIPATDPHFAHLLVNNEAPDTQGLEDIHRYLSGPRKELEEVSKETDVLETRLTSLHPKRITLRNTIQKYSGLCSPIRTLPQDILGEIFVRCLPEDRYPILLFNEAPLLLTTICRRWRDAALGTHQLWTKVHIVTKFYDMRLLHTPKHSLRKQDIAERQLNLLRLYVSRAGALPLRLSLVVNSEYELSNPSPVIGFIGSLLPSIQRIRWSAFEPFGEFIASYPIDSFQQLEGINIEWDEESDSFAHQPHGYFRAPSLHDVTIEALGPCPLDLPLKWSLLTRLALPRREIPQQELGEILRCCCILREGLFEVSGEEVGFGKCGVMRQYCPATPNSISLLYLRTLDITHQDCIGHLLRQLHTPNLSHLALKGSRSEEYRQSHIGCLPMFMDHNEECLTSIKSLTVKSGAYYPPIINKSLERLPNLRTLILVDKNGSSYFPRSTAKANREEFYEALLVRMTPPPITLVNFDANTNGGPVECSPSSPPPCLCPLLERFEFQNGAPTYPIDQASWRHDPDDSDDLDDPLVPELEDAPELDDDGDGLTSSLKRLRAAKKPIVLDEDDEDEEQEADIEGEGEGDGDEDEDEDETEDEGEKRYNALKMKDGNPKPRKTDATRDLRLVFKPDTAIINGVERAGVYCQLCKYKKNGELIKVKDGMPEHWSPQFLLGNVSSQRTYITRFHYPKYYRLCHARGIKPKATPSKGWVDPSETSKSGSQGSSRQVSITSFTVKDVLMPPVTEAGLLEYILEFIIDADLPYRIVEQKSFHRICYYLNSKTLKRDLVPHRTMVANAILEKGERLDIIDLEIIGKIRARITVVWDRWSTSHRKPFMAMGIQYVDDSTDEWKIKTMILYFELSTGRHTGKELGKELVCLVRKFHFEDKFSWAVGDNIATNDVGVRYACKKINKHRESSPLKAKEVRGQCISHTIHLEPSHFLKALHYGRRPMLQQQQGSSG